MTSSQGSINLLFSPFEYRCNISALHYLKMFVLSVIVLPVRALATGLTFLFALGLANFITPKSLLHATKPQKDLKRRLLMPILILLSRTVYFIGGIHWITIKGRRASRSEAPIIVLGPHSSFLDSLAVVAMGMSSCVATVEHAESFIGGIIRVLQPILVNRDNRHSREKTVAAISSRARSKEDWPQLLIFPEGTCTNGSCLLSFRQGAFQPGLPVQPVLLRWPNTVDSSTWVWKGPSVWKLLWMTFAQFTTRFEIEFLPVYNPTSEERMDPRLYANNVRAKMANALNVPTCDLLYDDFCRFQIATECGLPDPEAMVYLHGLLRTAFSLARFEHSRIGGKINYREWIHMRLENLLSTARRNGQLSQMAFIDAVFPNVRPDERETLLLNRAIQHYTTESGVDFRMFVTRACMFLFASDSRTALRYAVKAFPPKETHLSNSFFDSREPSETNAAISTWAISTLDAKQLLLYIFNIQQEDNLIFELLNLSAERVDHEVLVGCSGESASVHPDRLYAVLNAIPVHISTSYMQFEERFAKTLGRRGRPLLHFDDSASTGLPVSISSYNSSELLSSQRLAPDHTRVDDDLSVGQPLPNYSNSSQQVLTRIAPSPIDSNHHQTCAAAYRQMLPTTTFGNKLENT